MNLKSIGLGLLGLGIIVALFAFGQDTAPEGTYNLGLLQSQNPFDLYRSEPAPIDLPAIRFLNRDTNLIFVQVLAMIYLVEGAYHFQIDNVQFLSLVVIALAVFLYASTNRLAAMLLATLAALISAYTIANRSTIDYASLLEYDQFLMRRSIVPLWLVFSVLVTCATFPQLQLLRWGRFRLGAIKGDIVVNPNGNSVLLAFGSSVLIAATVATVDTFLNADYWLGRF